MYFSSGLPFGDLDSDVNECLLLHGTTADAVSAIAQNGIDLRLANPTGRYGSGIYLAQNSVKSNIYTGTYINLQLLILEYLVIVFMCTGMCVCVV